VKRYTSLSPPAGWAEDFHLQAAEHAQPDWRSIQKSLNREILATIRIAAEKGKAGLVAVSSDRQPQAFTAQPQAPTSPAKSGSFCKTPRNAQYPCGSGRPKTQAVLRQRRSAHASRSTKVPGRSRQTIRLELGIAQHYECSPWRVR
jgi:hypothetical protein